MSSWARLWSLERGLVPSHGAVLFRSHDGARIYACVLDRALRVVTLDARTGEVRGESLFTFPGADRELGEATRGAAAPDGVHCALGTRRGLVLLFAPASTLATFWRVGGAVERLEFSARGGKLMAAAHRQRVRVYDYANPRAAAVCVEGRAGASLSPDGATLAYVDANDPTRVRLASIERANTPAVEAYQHAAPLDEVTFDADGESLWVKVQDGTILLVSPRGAREVLCAPDAELARSARRDEVFAVGDEGARVVGVDGDVGLVAPAPRGRGDALRVDARGAVWSVRGALRWRDRDAPEAVEVASAHDGPVRAVAFSPDGTQVATGGDDGRVRLWRADDATPLWVFEGHTEPVGAVQYAPDGRTVYSVGGRGELKAWDLASGHERDTLAVRPLSGDGVLFEAMRVSPDGARLALRAGTPREVREVDLLRWREFTHPALDGAHWDIAYDPSCALALLTQPAQLLGGAVRLFASDDATLRASRAEGGWQAPRLGYRALAALGPDAGAMALSRDARSGHFVVGSADRNARFLSVTFNESVRFTRVALGRRRVAAAGPHGRVWCWSFDAQYRIWNPSEREGVWSAELPLRDAVTALALSGDERTLIAATDRGAVLAWREVRSA